MFRNVLCRENSEAGINVKNQNRTEDRKNIFDCLSHLGRASGFLGVTAEVLHTPTGSPAASGTFLEKTQYTQVETLYNISLSS